MTLQETFEYWAEEINKDWSKDYTADAKPESLVVTMDGEEVGRIDYDKGNYTVTADDEDVRGQLEYMVNR